MEAFQIEKSPNHALTYIIEPKRNVLISKHWNINTKFQTWGPIFDKYVPCIIFSLHYLNLYAKSKRWNVKKHPSPLNFVHKHYWLKGLTDHDHIVAKLSPSSNCNCV